MPGISFKQRRRTNECTIWLSRSIVTRLALVSIRDTQLATKLENTVGDVKNIRHLTPCNHSPDFAVGILFEKLEHRTWPSIKEEISDLIEQLIPS